MPYNGNEQWTNGLGIPVSKKWHPWLSDSQVAGYATIFNDNFSFITVRGAGHMVPQFQPTYAWTMFQNFVTNTPF